MPEKKTKERAKKALREGKSPTTAAGEFVREEIEHVREGVHGVRSTKQAIAIGLSKARRAGVPLAPPGKGQASSRTRKAAARDAKAGARKRPKTESEKKTSRRRARASTAALKREGKQAVSRQALSRQAKQASRRRARKSTR